MPARTFSFGAIGAATSNPTPLIPTCAATANGRGSCRLTGVTGTGRITPAADSPPVATSSTPEFVEELDAKSGFESLCICATVGWHRRIVAAIASALVEYVLDFIG